ncbi:phenylalanine--tRNA ligase subunit beta [Nanoarchaeota archaeon]
MPTINLNKTVFNDLVGKTLPDDELRERIPMLGTDLEKVEGDEIEVEIFPNRPDMLSEQGLARAFSSFIGEKTGLRRYELKKSGKTVVVDGSVSMRGYTACAIVKGVKFDDERIREIMQIQEKLAKTHGRNRRASAYGIYPTDNIEFPISYTAKDPKTVEFWPLGLPQPMRADDVEELHPKGREYKWIAEDWERYPFFIDNKDNVLCMLPYTNSHDTGKIDENTEEVFIECTGVDFRNVSVALNIFVTMLADMGGTIYSLDIKYPDKTVTTPDLEPKQMKLDVPFINKWLGLDISEEMMVLLLAKMGYGFDTGFILIPAYRADILHIVDIAEDVAIAYGYDKFEEDIPNVATIGEESPFEIFKRRVSDILVGLDLLETNTYNLTNDDDQNRKMSTSLQLVELESAVNTDYNVLRAWMTPCLLKVLQENKNHEYPQNIFESGNCFKIDETTETGVTEFTRLAVVLCGPDSDFTRIKQVLDCLASAIDFRYESEETELKSFIPGRVARISIEDDAIAYIGELHPTTLENWDIDMPTACFELNLSVLYKALKEPQA